MATAESPLRSEQTLLSIARTLPPDSTPGKGGSMGWPDVDNAFRPGGMDEKAQGPDQKFPDSAFGGRIRPSFCHSKELAPAKGAEDSTGQGFLACRRLATQTCALIGVCPPADKLLLLANWAS